MQSLPLTVIGWVGRTCRWLLHNSCTTLSFVRYSCTRLPCPQSQKSQSAATPSGHMPPQSHGKTPATKDHAGSFRVMLSCCCQLTARAGSVLQDDVKCMDDPCRMAAVTPTALHQMVPSQPETFPN